MRPISNQKGFSLLELSVVIVVVALLVAGITAGRALVQQARLRSVVQEQEQVKTAINSFRLQYDAIPGDIDNAFSYWSTNCAASAGLCNGNADTQIVVNTASATDSESYRAWQHLNLADLLPGSYTGVGIGDADGGELNGNIPASKFSGVGMTLRYSGTYSQNHIIFGGVRTNEISDGDVFTPIQASSIDEKLDDGAADTGVAYGFSTGGTCATGSAYALGTTTVVCYMGFNID